jgi:hypothetical protein
MSITRPKLSSIVESQLPEFIRDDYQTFVDFLKAYYEFLETTQADPVSLRDIDTTLDSFITYFKSELAQKLPYSTVDERFLLTRIKDLYLAKGSESSFKLLFRILFNKDITVNYPSTQMLRASDGKWNQDVSVFVQILVGNPQDIVGKLVDVVTQTKIVRVLVDRRQYVEVEVDRAIRVSDNIYEFILDRRFFGDLNIGDQLRYLDNNNNMIFNGIILPTTTGLKIESPGSGFKVGDLYTINNFQGYGTIMKISTVDSNGGITQAQFIKFGTGYTTDFSSSIISQLGQDNASTTGVIISRVDSFLAPANKAVALSISEQTSGFAESGSISTSDYNLPVTSKLTGTLTATNGITTVTGSGTTFTTQVAFGDYLTLNGVSCKVQSVTNNTTLVLSSNYTGTTSSSLTSVSNLRPAAFDGTYAGLTVREFGITSANSVVSTSSPAIIKVTLGALAKYPGYYVTNDSFLNDAIYIQDSKFYQAFSYVIKIDQSLETYKTIVKNLVHPAGMAVFGEYDLRNEFTINTTIESLIKILSVSLSDKVTSTESYVGFLTKGFNNTNLGTLLNGGDDTNQATPIDTVGTLTTRTVPSFTAVSGTLLTASDAGFLKSVTNTTLNFDGVAEGHSVATSGDVFTPTWTKLFNSTLYNHYLNNGTTLDTDTVTESDTVSAKDFSKALNATTLNYSGVLDDNSTAIIETAYGYSGGASRLGISAIDFSQALSDAPVVTDTNATSATDLNRTTPAISFTKTPITETYSGTTDSGGNFLVNPYAEAGWFLNDTGSYVGTAITFTG